MADRYWVGGTGDWDSSTTTHWAASSGGAGGETVPTSSDNVFFDLHSNESGDTAYTVTLTANAKCLNFDASFTGTTKVSIDVGMNSLDIYGNFNLSGGSAQVQMRGTFGALTFKATSGTQIVTTNGVDIGIDNFYLNGSGGTVQLADNFSHKPTLGGTIKKYAGTFDPNGKTYTISTGSSSLGIIDMNFYNLTITTTQNCNLTITNLTISNNLVLNGDSATKRIFIYSNEIGTQRTITAANVTVTNADFRDIKGAGAGSWNLSAITGGSGDCGGNTGITFTTANDWYWHEGTGNFDNYAKWYTATNGGGTQMASTRVPLPQDTCYFDANSFDSGSQTVTQNMARIGGVIWTGATNTPTWTTSTVTGVYGSITLISDMTLTSSTEGYTFYGRGSHTLTTAGKTWAKNIGIAIQGGTLTLQDDFTIGSSNIFTINNGTFDANDKNLSIGKLSIATGTKTISMGSGTWIITGASNQIIISSTDNLTFNRETSTVKLTGTLTDNTTLDLKGLTWYNFWNATTGDYYITIASSNTFNDFKIDANRKMKFAAGTTQTVNTFTATGTAGNLIVIRSTTTTNATLAKAGGGTISCDYIDIDYITGNPDTTWYMGTHSTDGGHNTRIYFTEPTMPVKIEKSLKYCVILTPDQLEKSLAYAIRAPTGIQKSLKYCVPSTATPIEKSLKYCILTIPSATEKSLAYSVVASIPVEKTLKYTVKAEASAIEKSLKYCILTTPTTTEKTLKYTILTEPTAIEKSLKYTVISTPSALTKSLKYTIESTPTGIEKGLIYTVLTDSKIELSLKYTILTEPSAVEKSLQYSVITTPSPTEKSLKYTVISTPSVIEKGLIYDVLVPSAVNKTLKYMILTTPSAITKSLEYDVSPARKIQKDLKYTVLESSGIQKSLEYNILTQGSETKSLQYTILTNDVITKSLKYCVLTDSKKTKSLTYTINSDQSITKGLSYVVVSRIKQEKELKYTILQDHKITKSLKYSVVPSEAISKSLKYTVVTPNVISLQLRICIKRYPYTKQTSPYTKQTSPYVPYVR